MPILQTDTIHEAARSPLFWTASITLVAAQLMALWLLCSHQMDRAEARQTAVQVERMAFDDCLQYLVGSTIGGCVSRLGAGRGTDAPEVVNTVGLQDSIIRR